MFFLNLSCQQAPNHNPSPCELANQLCRPPAPFNPPKNSQAAKRRSERRGSVFRLKLKVCEFDLIELDFWCADFRVKSVFQKLVGKTDM